MGEPAELAGGAFPDRAVAGQDDGPLAWAMRSTACRTTLWSAPGRRVFTAAIGASLLSSLATSSGNSMRVAPGFSASAVLNALRTTSGTVPASQMVCAHLVMGENMATESMFWWLSLCRRRVLP